MFFAEDAHVSVSSYHDMQVMYTLCLAMLGGPKLHRGRIIHHEQLQQLYSAVTPTGKVQDTLITFNNGLGPLKTKSGGEFQGVSWVRIFDPFLKSDHIVMHLISHGKATWSTDDTKLFG